MLYSVRIAVIPFGSVDRKTCLFLFFLLLKIFTCRRSFFFCLHTSILLLYQTARAGSYWIARSPDSPFIIFISILVRRRQSAHIIQMTKQPNNRHSFTFCRWRWFFSLELSVRVQRRWVLHHFEWKCVHSESTRFALIGHDVWPIQQTQTLLDRQCGCRCVEVQITRQRSSHTAACSHNFSNGFLSKAISIRVEECVLSGRCDSTPAN